MSSGYVVPLLGIAVVVLVYVLYLYTYGQTGSLATEVNLNATNPDVEVKASPQTTRFAVGTWIYINTWNSSATTPIITYKCGNGNTPIFSLGLAQTKPILNLTFGTGTTANTIAIRDNFPLQKWTYVVFSVDNTVVDLYLDGKLVKSVQLNTAPTFTTGDAKITYSIADIMLAKVYRWTNPLAPNDVWNEYMKGNGQSWSSTAYGVNLGLMQNGQETTRMRIL